MTAVELQIDSLDLDGHGVARNDGKVVFVAGALPGERVRAEIVGRKPKFDRARLLDVLRASPLRSRPQCPHFGLHAGACGGCSMQHVEPRAQVAIKQRVLEDALWHLGRLRPQRILRPVEGSPWGYRHRARLAVRYVAKKGGVLVGFHERGSSYVADMRECHVLPPRASRLLLPLRELVGGLSLRQRLPQVEVAVGSGEGNVERIVLVLRVLQPPTPEDLERIESFGSTHGVAVWLQPGGPHTAGPLSPEHQGELTMNLPEFGLALAFRPTDFTQVNHRINEVLVRIAVRLLDPQPGERVVDFFCGLGNFTLALARRCDAVLGIEGSDELLRRAAAAADRHRLAGRVRFAGRNLFEWTAADWGETTSSFGAVDRVLIDPPREGALAVARVLAKETGGPRRIVYVSCNPATLARDCAVLAHEGGWTLAAAGVVNMFPHTSHVESIAMLERGCGNDPAGAPAC
ncbi:MAG: 23S rRNA (uracil(1939)-C(5))-methyltransferase RlmD [Burkholderiales bacterium]|nr:23S rRNA (uracil(1939)-C(5))-methyltransferase RlmD [Burkholderiales bacterium]